jgi:integrase
VSRPRGLRVTRRSDTGALTIVGTVAGQRIRKRAQSNDRRLAEEEAAALEAAILRTEWHGERRGARSFSQAVMSYLDSAPRAPGTKRLLNRLLRAIGDVPLSAVDQGMVIRARRSMLAGNPAPATIVRNVIVPLRAVLLHAHRLGWCDAPAFEISRAPEGRTRYLFPSEASRLLEAAAPHIRVLLTILLGTGARMSEALELEWRDVDLQGARAIFWRTKGGKRRVASLPPSVVIALAALPHRQGPIVLTHHGIPYSNRDRNGGGQIKTAWRAALRRAGLDPDLTPHDCRHTWASWHYAVHRDLLALKVEGGWSSVALVERYAHLMKDGHEAEIRRWWHGSGTAPIVLEASA